LLTQVCCFIPYSVKYATFLHMLFSVSKIVDMERQLQLTTRSKPINQPSLYYYLEPNC